MTRAVWDALLAEIRFAFASSGLGEGFAPFPGHVAPQDVRPYAVPSLRLLQSERDLSTDRYANLRDAFLAAARYAHWRETYKETRIGQDFMDRFGCFSVIGDGGAFCSDELWCWLVYMPAGLYYPWHHHPGEEAYLVVAGEAEFMRAGHPSVLLKPGDTSLHGSNQPHAMQTHKKPVMCLVAWRNGFETPPVLTPSDQLI